MSRVADLVRVDVARAGATAAAGLVPVFGVLVVVGFPGVGLWRDVVVH